MNLGFKKVSDEEIIQLVELIESFTKSITSLNINLENKSKYDEYWKKNDIKNNNNITHKGAKAIAKLFHKFI